MTLSDELVQQLLAARAESRNLDIKKGFEWSDKTEETLGIVKDIMGCSNTQDGGTIIIGLDNTTFDFSSVSGNWWNSFDITKVMDVVNKYCQPPVNVSITVKPSIEHNGRNGPLVILQISEFDIAPIICVRSGITSGQRVIFNPAQIFIRTNRGATEPISNPDDLRDLIHRATIKNGDNLLRSIRALLKGQHLQQPIQSVDIYEQNVRDARSEI